MRVSFDYDGTLDNRDVEQYATELVFMGHDVFITTNRTGDKYSMSQMWNKDLFKTAVRIGIPAQNITFVGQGKKIDVLRGMKIAFHLDDDEYEKEDFKGHSVKFIDVNSPDWKERCNKIING